jgi:hypothetical protein
MNVKDTIKRSMLGYPSLYRTPGDVLHQLFAVNGNGYEWHHGELAYCGGFVEREDGEEWIKTQIAEAADDRYGLQLYYEHMLHEFQFTKQHIDRIIEHGETRYTSQLYPLCQYAGIMTVPADVKDDWLEAAYRFCEDSMVTIRQRHERTSEDDRHMALFKELRDKFDAMLIERGLHSTLAEREETTRKLVKMLKRAGV